MHDLSVWTRKGTKMPDPKNSVVIEDDDPTDGNPVTAKLEALGKMPDSGILMVEADDACTISIKCFSYASNKWRTPGSSSADFQKTFAAGAFDFFEAPANALFHLKVDTETAEMQIWHSGDPK